ncbi:Cytochrome c oxidase subunit CcoQ [Sulfitobacter noctilucae]|uniref:CcoQ/FixQ family Cbb3-type cytochrome c oxidase assembly chaperone n=1 Tax=Sulfitobacter noctilucae TaxID=1342302 RepID=UPI0004687C36|nr:CcoQ/FixQ family Cbb3-type cytochrome c oxidase assembly chaperone [Sulfitobacter noctilucae]KIN60555.1 Cytochrome c oxidase subunit CcoQ [Sulfitobacter noctilucae]
MDTYSFLRELADSWVLLAMFAFFIGAGVWAFWPGLRQSREDASMIPFRNETPRTVSTDPSGTRRPAPDLKKGPTDD